MFNIICVCYRNYRTWIIYFIIYIISLNVEHNDFDFESIEASISFVLDMTFGS